jgi:hypothetical protein
MGAVPMVRDRDISTRQKKDQTVPVKAFPPLPLPALEKCCAASPLLRSIYAITSTVSGNGDQGADPLELQSFRHPEPLRRSLASICRRVEPIRFLSGSAASTLSP